MSALTPQEARRLWVEALRAGEYTQTTGTLRDHTGYCCLGVAVKVLTSIADEEVREDNLAQYPKVRRTLGLRDSWGTYDPNSSLTEDNDSGKTFAEIADIIESEPDGLFK